MLAQAGHSLESRGVQLRDVVMDCSGHSTEMLLISFESAFFTAKLRVLVQFIPSQDELHRESHESVTQGLSDRSEQDCLLSDSIVTLYVFGRCRWSH